LQAAAVVEPAAVVLVDIEHLLEQLAAAGLLKMQQI
jgi:hypothetical protein